MQVESANGLEEAHRCVSTTMGGASAAGPTELLLLREMTHRINNELTSMIGFISRVAARSTNVGARLTLADVLMHLHEYARLHRLLQMPTENRLIDATAYLRCLCLAVSRTKLQNSRIELVFVEHPARLHSLQCWRLGMIVSELITNSYRHAFGEGGGTIHVELERRDSQAVCRVADDGGCCDIVQTGHGLNIVRQLVDALDGEFDLAFGKDGAVALVSFPMLQHVQDRSASAPGS